jgi:hypothetical protein
MATKDGVIEIALSNNYFFPNTAVDDMIIRTTHSDQKILIGTTTGAPSTVEISTDAFIVNRGLYIAQSLAAGKSNAAYQLDVGGSINITGSIYKNNGLYITDSNYLFSQFKVATPTRAITQLAQTQSSFNVFMNGDYNVDVHDVDIYQNGTKLAYIDSNNSDFTLSINRTGVATTVNITLSEAAQADDVIDITVWPRIPDSFLNSNTFVNVPLLSSNITTSNFTVTSNLVVANMVSVGKSNPAYALDVNGIINFTDNIYKNGQPLFVWTADPGRSNSIFYASNVAIGTSTGIANTRLYVANGDTRIDGSLVASNVSIGKRFGSYPLDIEGDMNIRGDIFTNRSLRMRGIRVQQSVGSGFQNLTPVVPGFCNDTVNARNVIFNSNGGGAISFIVGSNEVMRMNSNGVGIGTSNPTARLHVVGASPSNHSGLVRLNNIDLWTLITNSAMWSSDALFTASTDTGQWFQLYEVTNPRANATTSNIDYSRNNLNILNGMPFSRVGYYMQNRMNNGTVLYWAFVTMDAWSSNMTDYRIPGRADIVTQQRNTTNLNIYSNHPQVTKRMGANGRLEIWPYGYEPATFFGDGSGTIRDFDDTINLSGFFGSFQVHNITDLQTVFAWNKFTEAANNAIDIGFGPNNAQNIHFASAAGGNTDWTFASTSNYDWVLRVLLR